jgi:hypothetical protein
MLTSKRPQRRHSSAKDTPENERHGKRKAVSSTDLRVTFENVISSVSGYPDTALDKDSVTKCLKSIYDWMVFDSNMQLDLPVPLGVGTSKMWPHGATVDTRRGPDVTAVEKSSRKLKEVDDRTMVHVANSVVSSNVDEQRSVKSRGEVITMAPRGSIREQQPRSYTQPSSVGSFYPFERTRIVPDAYISEEPMQESFDSHLHEYPDKAQYPRQWSQREGGFLAQHFDPKEAYAGPPRPALNSQGYNAMQPSRRVVPRYSMAAGAPPPVPVQETPELTHVCVSAEKKKRKPKANAGRRQNDDDGVPVVFAD